MPAYDPKVIHTMAEKLYQSARTTELLYTLTGLAIGAGGGFFLSQDNLLIAVFLGLLGAAFGLAIGRARAFHLRVQAQIALCQVQIEQNTRAQ